MSPEIDGQNVQTTLRKKVQDTIAYYIPRQVPEDGRDLRVEVPETVPRYPELKLTAVAVSVAKTITVSLVAAFPFA